MTPTSIGCVTRWLRYMSEIPFTISAGQLPGRRIAEAWPLCRAQQSSLTREMWEEYAAERLSKDGGIIVAEDKLGIFHGLFSFALEPIGDTNTSFIVELFVALGLIPSSKMLVASILVDSISGIAVSRKCCRIYITSRPPLLANLEPDLRDFMKGKGYKPVGPDLCKELDLKL
jgi:hypothetical protein